MYFIRLDLYSEFEDAENPEFVCESKEELIKMMDFFFKNGYNVLVKKQEEV